MSHQYHKQRVSGRWWKYRLQIWRGFSFHCTSGMVTEVCQVRMISQHSNDGDALGPFPNMTVRSLLDWLVQATIFSSQYPPFFTSLISHPLFISPGVRRVGEYYLGIKEVLMQHTCSRLPGTWKTLDNGSIQACPDSVLGITSGWGQPTYINEGVYFNSWHGQSIHVTDWPTPRGWKAVTATSRCPRVV